MNDDFEQFQLDSELRMRLRPFVARQTGASAKEIALTFLESLSDDEYDDLIENYVASIVPLVDKAHVEDLRRKKHLS